MKKTCLADDGCPLARGYDAIGDWWSLLIVTRVVLFGQRRFGGIQADLGMARNILAARLRKLVDEGILEKVPASDGSVYHEYAPTPKGRALYVVLVALRQWGEAHCAGPGGPGAAPLVDRATGTPIPPVAVRAADGRVLAPDDLRAADAEAGGCAGGEAGGGGRQADIGAGAPLKGRGHSGRSAR